MTNHNIFLQLDRGCRAMLGFVFIYHGLVPKWLWLSPIEVHLVEASGLGLDAQWFSPMAGMFEILLGILIIVLRNHLWPIYSAAVALVLLCVSVAVVSPLLLVEAFNPITTNGLALTLCYFVVLLHQHKSNRE